MNAPWICGSCYHRNKAKRQTCIECGAERLKSKQEVRDAHRVSQVDVVECIQYERMPCVWKKYRTFR